MNEWTDIHPDFSKKIRPEVSEKTFQEKWIEEGFDYEQSKKWVEVGFFPLEKHDIYYTCLPSYWRDEGFTYQQTKLWISAGLRKDEFKFASCLKRKKINPRKVNLAEERKKEIEIQDWLDIVYPEKERTEITQLIIDKRKFTGDLVVNNWAKLEGMIVNNEFSSLKITNCPSLVSVFANNNQLTNLVIENCPRIERLHAESNKLTNLSSFENLTNLKVLDVWSNPLGGSLESLDNLTSLEELNISYTSINSGLEFLPDSIKKILCWETPFSRKYRFEIFYQQDYLNWQNGNRKLVSKTRGIINLKRNLEKLKLKGNYKLQVIISQSEERIKKPREELAKLEIKKAEFVESQKLLYLIEENEK